MQDEPFHICPLLFQPCPASFIPLRQFNGVFSRIDDDGVKGGSVGSPSNRCGYGREADVICSFGSHAHGGEAGMLIGVGSAQPRYVYVDGCAEEPHGQEH
ncbi:hypothetical protein SB717_33935, partial [Priestia sp. SIMBA_032]